MEPSEREIENEFYRERKQRRQSEQEEEKRSRKEAHWHRTDNNERIARLEHMVGDISSMPYIESQSMGSDQPFSMLNSKLSREEQDGELIQTRRRIPALHKSQSIYFVLSFLRKGQVVALQALSRRFYESLIPSFIYWMRVPLPPQFVLIDTDKSKIRTFLIDEALNPERKWFKEPFRMAP